MVKLVLLRHGESVWNKKNIFTGWTDVDLSRKGVKEALHAARILKKKGYEFEAAFTSYLRRSIKTLWIVLEETNQMWIPVHKSWRLNERHYGALQGLGKKKTAKEVGEEQVHIWRRGYDVRPPALKKNDPRNAMKEEKYKGIGVPLTECLKDTVKRFMPYWKKEIEPLLKKNKKVLICAHGNSLRAIVKYLDNIPNDEISHLNIPTGIPLVYELDRKLKPNKHYYLGDERKIMKAIKRKS